MFHRSDRLLLRPLFPEDWCAIFQAIHDEGLVRMLASAPWPYAEQDARDFAALPFNPHEPRFAITVPGPQGSTLVGCIGMGVLSDGMEMGYWIARPHWSRGYATEAGEALLALAAMMGLERLHAGHATDNPASGRVLEKLGFRATGEIREEFSRGRGQAMPVQRYVRALSQPAYGSKGADAPLQAA